MQKLPRSMQLLVDRLSDLPGIGPKSALRMAMTLLKWPEDKTRGLGQSITDLRDQLCICSQCAALADTDPCSICSDAMREQDKLCLVSEWDSLLVMEESGFFKGRYLVLGGLLSPLDGVRPDSLELDKLRENLQSGQTSEIILALGTTLEAETTGSYIKNMVEKEYPHVRVTRLAQGIPLGSDLKFMDKETLKQSMRFRQNI
ncbi:recombination protein RecR [Desulfonatronospira thiodismutans ASO3-1]|uniref:Recombination protein RecR n=1 Tax=Desulfonatronospira thiodismutans ASO3-1 TaxID=555779 RepID=D6SKE4_9BACT|nr:MULTISPECIES: recombination mediator RecR [Desulfonatronospira]EFI36347.1 recombination protein RecR [Desulfonatronospira thiodismutans ASO3-1]RQD73648.1 MAG: recombination protein RecR [Desulfonatronospira sp. MSAO_Bac3]